MPRASTPHPPLSRERVIEATVAVTDEPGVTAVSMRKVAERLGVEAMSLYHHVANNDAILDRDRRRRLRRDRAAGARPRLADGDAAAGHLGTRRALAPQQGARG